MNTITASGPQTVPNEDVLIQWLGGTLETDSYLSRGGDLSAPVSGPPKLRHRHRADRRQRCQC